MCSVPTPSAMGGCGNPGSLAMAPTNFAQGAIGNGKLGKILKVPSSPALFCQWTTILSVLASLFLAVPRS